MCMENPLHRIDRQYVDTANQAYVLALDEHRLHLLDPQRDLPPEQSLKLNSDIKCLIVDKTFDLDSEEGYKGLRDRETVVLGRHSDYGRFNFNQRVSGRHVRLTCSGTEVLVEDLNSTNGTFLGRAALGQLVETTLVRPKDEFAFEAGSVTAESYTRASARHPERNEDSSFYSIDKPAAGVFDGIGGQSGSALASKIAAESIQKELENQPAILPIGLSMLVMRGALQTAHTKIQNANPDMNIGTTATIAKLFKTENGRPYAAIASVADSRAYLYRNGKLSFVTLDSGYEISSAPDDVHKLQDTLAQVFDLSKLTDSEMEAFRRRNTIYTALGSAENPRISATCVDLEPGDVLLLTTDGVHDNLTTKEMEACIEDSDLKNCASLMVDRAFLRSSEGHLRSKPDDTTTVMLTYNG